MRLPGAAASTCRRRAGGLRTRSKSSEIPVARVRGSMRSYLDFEKPVAELEAKIEELRAMQAEGDAVAIGDDLSRLELKAAQALADLYDNLTPWQKTQVARHPQRPHCSDYIAGLMTEFTPFA